jgi:hypothetical protein
MKDGGAAVAVPARIGIGSIVAHQRLPERALPNLFSPSIPAQQLLRSLGQHSSNLPPLALDPGDLGGEALVPVVRHDGIGEANNILAVDLVDL